MSNFLSATNSLRKVTLCAVALLFGSAATAALAQNVDAPAYSSSSDQNLSFLTDGGPQAGGGYGSGGYRQYPKYGESRLSHLAIEAGAGFDAPVGNSSRTETFGANFKLGGGWNFNRTFGVLLEYEFNRTGIPNSILAAAGAPNGNVHIWGLTLDPIVYLKNNGGWGSYVTGGGGFYRKLTSFTQPVNLGYGCDFYGYCYPQYGNVTLSHFSSNQGGGNIRVGLTHSIGQSAKFYAEAGYLYVASPKASATAAGSGSVSMIPATFGIRF